MLDEMIAVVEQRESDLARLDDDGGKQTTLAPVLRSRAPMIPGAREPGMLTTFGVHAVVFAGSGIAMDAATTAARQREGGGAPNQRRPAREGSLLTDLWQRFFRATHSS